jgi:RsiW-degrading membrane proteinase PrsW (M82 family)
MEMIMYFMWAMAMVLATGYCLWQFVLAEKPDPDYLAVIWFAAFFGPYTLGLIALCLCMFLPVVGLELLRDKVQKSKGSE